MPTNQAKFTLCPHCSTAFTVNSSQLEAALGAVRCGKCKKIFNAKFNLVASNEESAAPAINTSDNLTLTEEEQFSVVESKQNSWLDTPNEANLDTLIPEPMYLTNQPNTQGTTMSKKKSNKILILLITLVLAIAVGVGGTLWFVNSGKQGDFKVTKVKLKATASMLQLNVQFTLTNISEQTLVVPPVEIQLLNLAKQPMAVHHASSSSLGAPSSVIQPKQSYDLNYTVPTPDALGVSSAKVILK